MSVRAAVERAAGGPVEYVETLPVVETFQGKTVWKGLVEVYRVASPPPDKAYGWEVVDTGDSQFVAVLGYSPVDSPIAAVRAWLVSRQKT